MQQQTAGSSTPNLADRVRRAADRRPDRVALHWRDRTVTWSELDATVDGVARALTRAAPATDPTSGEPPARVAVALPNCPDFVLGYLGALRAGLVAVPLNPGLTATELRHVLADSGAAVLIATPTVADLVAGIAPDLPALTAVHTEVPNEPGPAVPSIRGGDDLAVLLYTSGTEGRPKGAMLSHRALAANHEQVERITPPVVGPDDTVLLALPLFHAYGLNTGLGSVVYHGATGVLVDEFTTVGALDEIARHRVSVLVGVPSMFQAWAAAGEAVAAATASVRAAVCGAAPLEPAVAARFAGVAGRPVHVGYGLTETAPVLTSTLVDGEPKPGSIGRALPGVELRLVAPDGTDLWRDGVPPPEDDADEMDLDVSSPGTDPGQIVVRGANLFAGYWPDGRGGPDPDGWWATGDVAYADADGALFLVDRLREVILVNGFNVYPHEVELVLQGHPAVAESAVLGVPHPRTGETVRAYVVPTPAGTVGAEELLAHCARHLARFKCPTSVEFVDALPHSAIGKVRKTLLRPPAAGDAHGGSDVQ
ncbi:AMP-binding protein [Micromonospora sp. NPDC050187]|uniref:AMP-binding protein n=1 Tax=Micromonospora sp. NPDC050187 TaxID=3364277 RepID=UPI00378B9683